MLFFISLLAGCMNQAHAHAYDYSHYTGHSHYHTSVNPGSVWVSGHYDMHGYWVPGYWSTYPQNRYPGTWYVIPTPAVDTCHRHRNGRRHCGRH